MNKKVSAKSLLLPTQSASLSIIRHFLAHTHKPSLSSVAFSPCPIGVTHPALNPVFQPIEEWNIHQRQHSQGPPALQQPLGDEAAPTLSCRLLWTVILRGRDSDVHANQRLPITLCQISWRGEEQTRLQLLSNTTRGVALPSRLLDCWSNLLASLPPALCRSLHFDELSNSFNCRLKMVDAASFGGENAWSCKCLKHLC